MSVYQPHEPPRRISHCGQQRRVGVEIEFAAISAREGAYLVRELYGGEIIEEDPHRYHIQGTGLGSFTSELAASKPSTFAPDRDGISSFAAGLSTFFSLSSQKGWTFVPTKWAKSRSSAPSPPKSKGES